MSSLKNLEAETRELANFPKQLHESKEICDEESLSKFIFDKEKGEKILSWYDKVCYSLTELIRLTFGCLILSIDQEREPFQDKNEINLILGKIQKNNKLEKIMLKKGYSTIERNDALRVIAYGILWLFIEHENPLIQVKVIRNCPLLRRPPS